MDFRQQFKQRKCFCQQYKKEKILSSAVLSFFQFYFVYYFPIHNIMLIYKRKPCKNFIAICEINVFVWAVMLVMMQMVDRLQFQFEITISFQIMEIYNWNWNSLHSNVRKDCNYIWCPEWIIWQAAWMFLNSYKDCSCGNFWYFNFEMM